MSFVNGFILCWLLFCAVSDWRSRRVPNLASFGFLALAALVLLWRGESLTGTTPAAAGLGLAMALLLTLPGFVLNRLGGGDVKLLAGLGLATDARLVAMTFLVGTGVLLLGTGVQRLRGRGRGPDSTDREWPFIPSLMLGYVAACLLYAR